jgi:RNA polymerase I-specific transcription initiation factor RRN3
LDSYFPFDPYNLKRSKHWIQDCYIEWQPVEGLEDDDDDEDSVDESDNGSETEEEAEDDSNGIHE